MSFVTQNFWQTFKPVELIDKARGYFSLAWTQDVTINWLGASEVLMQYNYAATGNFTIDELPDLSGLTDIGIVACIRYQVDGEVTRYKLNEVDGDTTFYPLYNGEVILKNFTIELWSGVSSASLAVAFASVQFNISRLKAKVTLTEDDTYEDCVEVSCTSIYNINAAPVAPILTNCFARWRGDTGVIAGSGLVSSWTDSINGLVLAQGTANKKPTLQIDSQINGQTYLYFTTLHAQSLVGTNIFNAIGNLPANHIYMVIKQVLWNDGGYLYQFKDFNGGTDQHGKQFTTSPNVNFDLIADTDSAALTTWYIFDISYDADGNAIYNIYDVAGTTRTQIVGSNAPTGLAGLTLGGLTEGVATPEMAVAEIILYSAKQSNADNLTTIQYLLNRYAAKNLTLPLQYTACAVGTTN